MDRREFHKLLGLGAAAGLSLPSLLRAQPQTGDAYHLPRFGNVHLMHMTDVHAQLLPVHYREPSVNIGVPDARPRPPPTLMSIDFDITNCEIECFDTPSFQRSPETHKTWKGVR